MFIRIGGSKGVPRKRPGVQILSFSYSFRQKKKVSQWRIYIVKFWTRAPPPLGVQILSISCSFWEILAKSYVGAPPGELAPPPRGNPRSATVSASTLGVSAPTQENPGSATDLFWYYSSSLGVQM